MGYQNFITAEFLQQNNSSHYGVANQRKNLLKFSRVSPGNQLLAKEPEDSGCKVLPWVTPHGMVDKMRISM